MEGSTSASGAPIANASTGAMINPASAARKRAQNTLQMQLVIVSFMNQTADVIDNWCTPTNHKLNVGLDKCLLSVIANLETEVKSEESPIYKSPVPSKDVSRPSPSIYVSPSALVSGSLQAVKGWIRDWIMKHRIAQEAEKTTGSGDNGGPAPTREDIAIAEEMNNLVAEIDRIDKARTVGKWGLCPSTLPWAAVPAGEGRAAQHVRWWAGLGASIKGPGPCAPSAEHLPSQIQVPLERWHRSAEIVRNLVSAVVAGPAVGEKCRKWENPTHGRKVDSVLAPHTNEWPFCLDYAETPLD